MGLRCGGTLPFRRQARIQSRAIKRAEPPQDLVGAVVFLCSQDSDFVTDQTLVPVDEVVQILQADSVAAMGVMNIEDQFLGSSSVRAPNFRRDRAPECENRAGLWSAMAAR